VGRKKFVRTTEPRKPPPEKPDRLEQLKATKVAAALLTTVVIIGIIWILWRDIIRVGGNSDYVPRAVLTVVGILILIGVGYRCEWTGFEERDREKSETGEIQRRKTLWDWMDLLLVPLMIAGIASWFTWWQNNSQQALEARQRAQEQALLVRQIAQLQESQAQYSALQSYIDQMTQLINERNLSGSEEGDRVFTLAQARTTTTIMQLDGEQNQALTRFLSGSGLLREPPLLAKVVLEGAQLQKTGLQEANLAGTDLTGTNLAGAVLFSADFSATDKVGDNIIHLTADLTRADLSEAALQEADLAECTLGKVTLTKATLQGADLSSAESTDILKDAPLRFLKKEATNLTDANLSHAALQDADLSGAVLQNANLTNAILSDANLTDAYLSDADLSGARGWTVEQLRQAKSLEGATMPDGQTLKSDDNPDGPTPEEWLKSRDREEDGKDG
jgi:uncharacterized protein YjbI with pentapeptide repeats